MVDDDGGTRWIRIISRTIVMDGMANDGRWLFGIRFCGKSDNWGGAPGKAWLEKIQCQQAAGVSYRIYFEKHSAVVEGRIT
ncbi:hypothetical protein [Komagataeibacter swingsii]|uniref:hypothetical protein n=1 Tax=Komagataeibacter swingsii TaxID=215220 RepID=UPI002156C3F9|nr:hypothetical protein [Komagataeibacter swingsii]GBQ59547.1 hypothetical protein AA16373_1606 [Komagataeibacter swingsii DSM 16373]